MHECLLEQQARVSRKAANACSLWTLYSGSHRYTHQEVLMDWNLVYEWQRVQLQPAVNDNHVQRHLLDKNAVPDYGVPLFSVHRVTVGRPWIDTGLGGVQRINRCKIKCLLFDQIDRKPASLLLAAFSSRVSMRISG
jgi:hypothetical protein